MLKDNKNLEVVGITEASDTDAIKDFRESTGAEYPLLLGVSADTKNDYEFKGAPSFVVLAADGTVAGRDEAALEKSLGGA